MATHGTIKTFNKFLWLPLTINGVTHWLTTQKYTSKFVHDVHAYNGHWHHLHWGDADNDDYSNTGLVVAGYF